MKDYRRARLFFIGPRATGCLSRCRIQPPSSDADVVGFGCLDEALVEEAMRYVEVKSKRELLDLALREFIAARRRPDLSALFGAVEPELKCAPMGMAH